MLAGKILCFSALVMFAAACGKKDDSEDDAAPGDRPEIPLNSPADLIGSWIQCLATSEATSTDAVYEFNADGSLVFQSGTYRSKDCSGGSASPVLILKGSYVIGSGNALDFMFGKVDDPGSFRSYRVFSVQADTLLISNNPGPGSSAANRDDDLSSEAMRLTRVR